MNTKEELFWEKVEKTDGCWLWRAGKNGSGRALFDGRSASRFAYRLMIGDFKNELCVCHRCDNPACVNPSHLFLGTQEDNIRDMYAKGRNRNVGVRGEKNPMAKLTSERVREIRELSSSGVRGASLSRMFGMSPMQISRIVRGHAWR